MAPTVTVTGSSAFKAKHIECGEAEQSVRCEQRSDDDRRNSGVAERKADGGAKHQRKHGGGDPEGDRAVAGAAEQREVDLQAGEEHQQQFAELRHEIRDRAVGAEKAENIRTDNDAAEQQAYGRGNVQAATKAGNGDEHHHPEREFRENWQREEVVSDKVEELRSHCLASWTKIQPVGREWRPCACTWPQNRVLTGQTRRCASNRSLW